MKKESVLYATIGLLAGIILAWAVAVTAVNNDNRVMMGMMGMQGRHSVKDDHGSGSDMSMAQMSESLRDKSGDAFDEAFLNMMIEHHEGAIEMAELARSRAKHDEIKQLSEAIITAQAKEIADMKKWQKLWAYDSDETMPMMEGAH